MLRGVYEIVEPIVEFKNAVIPYLGPAANAFIGTVKDALPRVKYTDSADSYWIYQGEMPSFRSAVVGTTDALSTIHPNYLLVAATFVAAFFILYIKMKYPFWNQIPALHVYDWHRRLFYSERPFIVHSIPKKTKYYEPLFVKTKRFGDLERGTSIGFTEFAYEVTKSEIAKLLQNNYLPSDRVFCSIQVPELAAQCSGATISTWNLIENDIVKTADIPLPLSGKTPDVIVKSKIRAIEGFIASRKINTSVSVGSGESRYVVQESANYIDYLCFDRKYTSTDKVRRLFHTHEYNERLIYPERQITLFKKEIELCDAIVPLVEYEALTFYLRFQIKPENLPANFQLVRIQREHLQHLHDWMGRVASLKEDTGVRVSVTAEIGDLIHLLQTNQMFAYALKGPDLDVETKFDAVYAIYFFRDAHMKYEDLDGGDTLHAIAAFCNTDDFELYFLGFVWAVRESRRDLSGSETKMLMVDDLGNLRGIVNRWQKTHDVVLRAKCAYYFCNYVVPRSPYDAEVVNILL